MFEGPYWMRGANGLSRREFLRAGAYGAAGAAIFASGGSGLGSSSADVVFRGGPIITMNPAMARAEALAVSEGRILAVGSLAEIQELSGSSTQIVDLDGRALMPGMIDPHMHPYSVVKDDFINISPTAVSSYDEVMQKLNERAATLGEGEWLLAADYDSVVTPGGKIFTMDDLNRIAPNNPLLILEGSGHAAYANARAFEIVGVTKDTPNPVAARYIKGQDGELTGRMEEIPTFGLFLNAAQSLTDEDMQQRTLRLFNKASRVGFTAVGDPSTGQNAGMGDLELLDAIKSRSPIRHRGFLISTNMDDWDAAGIKPFQGDDKFRLSKIKAWSDGATQAFSSYLREPYLGSDNRGALNYTEEELYAAAKRAHEGGWPLAIHANGDAAIDLVLDIYERLLSETPFEDHRHRIEHCSIGHLDQYEKMAELGVSPTYLSGHIRWWGKAFRDNLLGPDRIEYYDAAATALEKGIRFSMHSDYSVTDVGPLRCVQDMVTRVMADGGEVFAPDQRIPVEEALKGVTTYAAWQLHMDDIAGSLEPGKYADLAILEDDPTAVDPMNIDSIQVSETWLEGAKRENA